MLKNINTLTYINTGIDTTFTQSLSNVDNNHNCKENQWNRCKNKKTQRWQLDVV